MELTTMSATTEGLDDEMVDLLSSLAGAELHLYKLGFDPTPQSVIADFAAAEADFVGYAAVVLTYSSAAHNADGSVVTVTNRAFYEATDATAPNTIGGAWIESTLPVSVRYVIFDTPVPMTDTSNWMAMVVNILLPGPATALVES